MNSSEDFLPFHEKSIGKRRRDSSASRLLALPILDESAQTLLALEPSAIQRPKIVPQEIEASRDESRAAK